MNDKHRLGIFVLYGFKSLNDYEKNISFYFSALQMLWQFSFYIPDLILEYHILEAKKMQCYNLP